MKIFITGIAGFLGSHLASRMIALGHDVSGNDNLIGGYLDNIPSSVTFYNIDCCDLDKMTQVMRGSEVVYHCAATAHEGLSVFSPNFITRNIFQATIMCLCLCVSVSVSVCVCAVLAGRVSGLVLAHNG